MRGPRHLLHRADWQGLATRLRPSLSLIHLWDDLVKHGSLMRNNFLQLNWREGLAIYFIMPTCIGWFCSILSASLVGLWDAYLVKHQLTLLKEFQ